jgi:hypothetical protein
MTGLKTNEIYQHYKGNQYKLVATAKHSETLEEMVVYQALYGDGAVWVRPKAMFLENVDVDGKSVPRFVLLEDSQPDQLPS